MNDGRGPASPPSGLAGPFACAGSRERAPRHRAYSRVALPGGDTGAALGRRYGLRSYEGPAPEAMADDFLAGFDQIFPGTRQAYNGWAYYAWSTGDPHIGGAASLIRALADRRRIVAARSCRCVSARGLRALHRRSSGVTGRGTVPEKGEQ